MSLADVRFSRKKAVIGAGLGLAASVLAACATYGRNSDSAPAPAPGGATTPAPGGAAPDTQAIASTADVPVGSGVIVGDVVLTQATPGDFRGFTTTCTHNGCTVNGVADGTINCPCHGSKFNLDGTVANGPAARPLDSKPVTVDGDAIRLG